MLICPTQQIEKKEIKSDKPCGVEENRFKGCWGCSGGVVPARLYRHSPRDSSVPTTTQGAGSVAQLCCLCFSAIQLFLSPSHIDGWDHFLKTQKFLTILENAY